MVWSAPRTRAQAVLVRLVSPRAGGNILHAGNHCRAIGLHAECAGDLRVFLLCGHQESVKGGRVDENAHRPYTSARCSSWSMATREGPSGSTYLPKTAAASLTRSARLRSAGSADKRSDTHLRTASDREIPRSCAQRFRWLCCSSVSCICVRIIM